MAARSRSFISRYATSFLSFWESTRTKTLRSHTIVLYGRLLPTSHNTPSLKSHSFTFTGRRWDLFLLEKYVQIQQLWWCVSLQRRTFVIAFSEQWIFGLKVARVPSMYPRAPLSTIHLYFFEVPRGRYFSYPTPPKNSSSRPVYHPQSGSCANVVQPTRFPQNLFCVKLISGMWGFDLCLDRHIYNGKFLAGRNSL